MNKLLFGALVLLLVGCKSTNNTANSSHTLEQQGEMWERVQGTQGLALRLHATNAIETSSGNTTPLLYVGCGGLATALMITAPGNVPVSNPKAANVRVALDGASPVQQKWVEFADDSGRHWSPSPAAARLNLLMQMLDAKTLQIDLSPKSRDPQTATFNIQGFRAAFTRESDCAAWKDANRYK